MSTLNQRNRSVAPLAVRLQKRTSVDLFTSYPTLPDSSTAPRDETELSWELFSDHVWPTDAWVVGADVDPELWPTAEFGKDGAE